MSDPAEEKRRRMAEEEKARGNALFAQGKVKDAMASYAKALGVLGPRGGGEARASAWERQLEVALRSNSSACYLALGDAEQAAGEARAALALDATFEKGWLRLATAEEALGHRAEALAAFRKVSSTALAKERIPVLEAPPIEVTAEGLSGVPEGSLDPAELAEFTDPGRFFANRIFLPSEPLVKGEARASSHDYNLRLFMDGLVDFLQTEKRRFMVLEDKRRKERLWLRIIGRFLSLPNVACDGRSRKVSRNSSQIPVILVAVWTGQGQPSASIAQQTAVAPFFVNLKRMRAVLLRNATLLTPEATRRSKVDRGFTLSVLTHVAAPELDYSIHEGCSAPGCKVECSMYRCGRCFITRYCGQEHLEAHWPEHKPHCVPVAERGPKVEFDCFVAYLDHAANAEYHGIDCVAVPKKTFPGLTVVKIQLNRGKRFKICDPNGVLVMKICKHSEVFQLFRQLFLQLATVTDGEGVAYCDADLSQEGRMVMFFDHKWKCTW
jgi:hypothetical protein